MTIGTVRPELNYLRSASAAEHGIPEWLTAALVCLGYFIGTKIGFALTFQPNPISILWPPNSILLAALVLTKPRSWWLLLLAAFPAHLAGQAESGVPAIQVIAWFISNCSEALIGAGCIYWLVRGPLRFDSFRHVCIFVLFGALFAPFVSSFIDVAFVTAIGWGQGSYTTLWKTRFFSNMLTSLVLVPVIVTWVTLGSGTLRTARVQRYAEAGALLFGLLLVSFTVFVANTLDSSATPVLLYAPVPFLLWAALRLGPLGTSTSLLMVAIFVIWGAMHGYGPFVAALPEDSVLSIQLFLSVLSITLLLLSAVIEQNGQTAKALRDSEERFRLAISAAKMGTWDWWIQLNTASWSEESNQMAGIAGPHNALTFEHFRNLLHPDDRDAVTRGMYRAMVDKLPFEAEFRVVRPDETVRWVLGKGAVLYDETGKPDRMLGVNVDITDRKRAEEALREQMTLKESEARFRKLADAMPQIVWTATPDGQVEYFNRRTYELIGIQEGATGGEMWRVVHPDDRPACLDAWNNAVKSGRPYETECRLLVSETCQYRWYLARALPVRDDAGDVVRWYGTATDIDDQKHAERVLQEIRDRLEHVVNERTVQLLRVNTSLREEIADRARAEQALRTSEERFAKAFHSGPDSVCIAQQANRRLIDVNDRWQTLFGFARDDALGRTLVELGIVRPPDQTKLDRLLKTHGHARNVELNLNTRLGDTLEAIFNAETVEISGELCYISVIRDMTSQRRAEREAQDQRHQMAHLTRVAVLGQLSGALAHELNQPLTAILSNAQAAQRFLKRDSVDLDEVRAIIDDIVSDDKRAGEVIRRLRALLKRGEAQLQAIDLNDVVAEALKLAQGDLSLRNISVSTTLAKDSVAVRGDRIQLQQVLLNLIMNAADAMNAIPQDERHLSIVVGSNIAGQGLVSLADRGPGIPPDRIEKLFEPFFTTKEHGLGLGLSISRSIANAHSGSLWAENNLGRGATFHLTLPTSESQ